MIQPIFYNTKYCILFYFLCVLYTLSRFGCSLLCLNLACVSCAPSNPACALHVQSVLSRVLAILFKERTNKHETGDYWREVRETEVERVRRSVCRLFICTRSATSRHRDALSVQKSRPRIDCVVFRGKASRSRLNGVTLVWYRVR